MKKYVDGGQGLLEAFRALDVDYVFTASGSEWAPYWEAVSRQKEEGTEGPVYLDLWHETVAAAMATGYTLVTGRMQAVLLHAGPGLLQGACAVHGALLAGAPMLVFSSESLTYGERESVDPGSQWYRNLSIVGGPHTMAAPFVKWSNQVQSIETLYEMVVRAGELSQRNLPGPVYLNVPVEVLLEPWTAPKFPRQVPPPALKVSPAEEISVLVDSLLEAKNPVVLTETAGQDAAAFHALAELCDKLGIPVVEPQSAVCANYPRRNPMHQGGAVDKFVNDDTDLVVLVNCRAPWYSPSNKPANAKTIVIDETPQRPHIVYQVLHANMYLEGNVARTLQAAVKEVDARGFNAEAVVERYAKFGAAHDQMMAKIEAAENKAASSEGLVDPIHLVKCLRDNTESDAVFVDESITHARLMQQHLLLDEPGRYYYSQGGLGQGIGQALGVKLATGDDKLVVFTVGDGSFLYNPILPSFSAAKDLNLPILIVIFNNLKYRSMQLNHLRFYPDGVAAGNNDFNGVNLDSQPDLASFTEPYGMFGRTVSNNEELEKGLAEAVAAVKSGTTAVLNVMVSR
ncbi:MAG: hypothetical protein JKY66_00930 [Spongiibacteraceae bacterium]|nr:hypothetical protein [Spongiibacteraceae bacterium]